MAPRRCITLLTDFGTADGYVGAMKGVLLTICPEAQLVDLSHDISAGDVTSGAFALAAAAPEFPRGTIHLAVVDPDVGTKRRALLVETGGSFFVGPDNGVISLAAAARAGRGIWVLDRPEWFRHPVSTTFHGRDVFAPVAARLASGVAADELGTRARDMKEIRIPEPRHEDAVLVGEVIHSDRFGNVITNLHARHLSAEARGSCVTVGGGHRRIPLLDTYGCVAPGDLVALVGSSGYVEIAVNLGSARIELGESARLGAPVRLFAER